MKQKELLNEAIIKINTASEALVKYYSLLEEKIKLLTDEVDQKQRLLSSIINSIDIAVVFFDRNGVIRLINKSAELLFGIKNDEIIGKRELPIEIKDDMIFPKNSNKPFNAILSQSQVLDSEGNIIGHVFLCKDITRIKELEAENERNRRLTAMGSLLMKIAHEIRNPLGSIELFANMISNDLKNAVHGDYAKRISNAVSMLRNTLENMLSYTKGINPKKEKSSINTLINEIIQEFSELFQRSSIRINFESEGEYSLPIDISLIRQALINIFVNAYQAMPEGGELIIKTSQKDNFINISIKDSGQGIDENILDRIFEPFFSTKDRGSGLGLSITNSIIKSHDGKIEVKSQTGKGTEFAIFLPLE